MSHVLIFGDFNYREIDWASMSVTGRDESTQVQFYNVLQDMFLVQHVNFPTRFRIGQQPTMPDLIFTNEENMVEDLKSVSPLGSSDHTGLIWTFVCSSDVEKTDRVASRLNFKRAKLENMEKNLASFEWESDFQGKDVEECWTLFSERCEKVIHDNVPMVKVKAPRPPWLRDA